MAKARFTHSFYLKALGSIGVFLFASICMFVLAEQASAHGYVESPGSRAYLCKLGQNSDCGAVVYEPQSLEAPKGFPAAGPADGKIASAGGVFPKLDEQSANRWTKVNISAGLNTFTWKLTAAHATASWRYFITKPDWNPNAPLTRDSFDLTPFHSVDYGGVQPPFTYSDTMNVPARTGYHVILAVWDIADTANAFYNVIDVNFGGSNPADNQAPSAPGNLHVLGTPTTSSVQLMWNAATDNVGVTGYKVYRGTNLVATLSGSTTSFTVTGLSANTTYAFTVKAIDAAGNESVASNSVSATTSPASSSAQPWAAGITYAVGDLVSYNGSTYECRQAHTSLTGWEPSVVPALWLLK